MDNHNLQVPANFFTCSNQIIQENITFCGARVNKTSLRLELSLKKKRQFQKIMF